MSSNPEWDYIEQLWNDHATYRGIMAEPRRAVRMEEEIEWSIFGDKEKMPKNGRPLSTVMQFRSFAVRYPPVDVISKDDSDREEKKALKIQQHLEGVPYRVSRVGQSPYVDALHYAAEVGRALLYTWFDVGLAAQGKYPLRVDAIDPLSCAYQEGVDGLLGAVIRETYTARDLYTSLKKKWEAAQEYRAKGEEAKAWAIPETLKDQSDKDPLLDIETSLLLTEDKCCFYIGEVSTWEYNLKPKGVPLDLAYCMDIPSKKNWQKGLGLIYPIKGLLDKEWMLLNKEALGSQFFTFPFLVYKDNAGALWFRQVKPTKDSYPDVAEYQIYTPTPNYQAVEMLLNKLENSIGRLALAEVSFGEGANATSGYQVSLMTEGPMRRIEDELSQYQRMRERQYGRMLRHIEEWANEDMAGLLGFKGADVATYMSAWATVAEGKKTPGKKTSNRAPLLSADVVGYGEDDIRITLLPETPQDENAKYQRAGLAKTAGMPQKWIDVNVMNVENPAEVQQQRDEEMLLAQNQDWSNFMTEETRLGILEGDTTLTEHWALFMKAQGKNPDGTPLDQQQIDPNAPPQDMGQQAPPQFDPSQMQQPPDMNPNGGLVPDMQGVPPSMMPPQEMGMIPNNGMQTGMPPLGGMQ